MARMFYLISTAFVTGTCSGFGQHALIGKDDCVDKNGLQLHDNGICNEDLAKECDLGTDSKDCTDSHSLKNWRFTCLGEYDLYFDESTVMCGIKGGPASECGTYKFNGAVLRGDGKFFGNTEDANFVANRTSSAKTMEIWKESIFAFRANIPGIGEAWCQAEATFSPRFSRSQYRGYECPAEPSSNQYVNRFDIVKVFFGWGGDFRIIINSQEVAHGVYLLYGDALDGVGQRYTALLGPNQPDVRYKNAIVTGRNRDGLQSNDWTTLPSTKGCAWDRVSTVAQTYLPTTNNEYYKLTNIHDSCDGLYNDACRQCLLTQSHVAIFVDKLGEDFNQNNVSDCKEDLISANDASCGRRGEYFCTHTATKNANSCVKNCGQCGFYEAKPNEGLYAYEGPNTCEIDRQMLVSNSYISLGCSSDSCTDHSYATINDKCVETNEGKICRGTDRCAEPCGTPPMCFKYTSCNSRTGECVMEPLSDDSTCNDGDNRTKDDVCKSGKCVGKADIGGLCGGAICKDLFAPQSGSPLSCSITWMDGCYEQPPQGYTESSNGCDMCPSFCAGECVASERSSTAAYTTKALTSGNMLQTSSSILYTNEKITSTANSEIITCDNTVLVSAIQDKVASAPGASICSTLLQQAASQDQDWRSQICKCLRFFDAAEAQGIGKVNDAACYAFPESNETLLRQWTNCQPETTVTVNGVQETCLRHWALLVAALSSYIILA